MRRVSASRVFHVAVVVPLLAAAAIGCRAPRMVSQELPAAATAAFLAASRSRPPFELEPNVGQAAPGIRFLGRSEGMTLLFQADRVDLVAEGGRVRLRFVDAEPALEPAPCEPTGGRSHYFQGDDPDHWRVGVPRFAALRYSGVYPGIDAVFRDNGSTTEYDFFVAPGADPRAIRLILEGADEVSLEPSGDIVVLAGRQRIVQRAPVIFQQDGLGRLAVEGGWELQDDGTLGFRIGAYDPARTLVIDPVVDFSTYIGGSASDGVQGIAVDGEGYIFLTGNTLSVNFPLQDPFDGTLSGLSDAFIAKLDPSGQRLIFSTYFGGTSTDDGREIALGPGGDVHVAGATASTDFPTVTAFQNSFGGNQDAFVARFDPTGAVLERSSYLGGSGGDGPGGLSVDGSGGVFVSGLVQSSDFPVTLGAFQPAYGGSGDVFVTKVNASGSLAYSSYLGGSDFDTGGANAIDSSGNVYVAGVTESADFPVMNGLDDTFSGGSRDGFVAKISPTGAELLWSTFLGGSGFDAALGVDLDQSRNVYVTGQTGSADFPVDDDLDPTLGGTFDGFATKLDPTGTSILYSRYLGGSAADASTDIAVDQYGGQALVVGSTSSADFPVAAAVQPANGGGQDSFVLKLSSAGGIVWSTYLGGGGSESNPVVAIGPEGEVQVGGVTSSSDFPLVRALDSVLSGPSDGFLVKLADPFRVFVATRPGPAGVGSVE